MSGHESPRVRPPQMRHRLLQTMVTGRAKMHPTEDRLDAFPTGQALNVEQSVHHAGVCAAEQHHHARRRLKEHRLVVQQRVGLLATFVEKEWSAAVLEIGLARDFAGDEQTRDHFLAIRRQNEP